MAYSMTQGMPQPDGSVRVEAVMDVDHVASSVLHMAELPLDANVQFMTVMATTMPYIGRDRNQCYVLPSMGAPPCQRRATGQTSILVRPSWSAHGVDCCDACAYRPSLIGPLLRLAFEIA